MSGVSHQVINKMMVDLPVDSFPDMIAEGHIGV